MIKELIVLVPLFPITSTIPPHEQCREKLIHWSKNVDVVVKHCATEDVTVTRYKAQK